MRELTTEELELIIGAQSSMEYLPTVVIIGSPPGGDPSPPSPSPSDPIPDPAPPGPPSNGGGSPPPPLPPCTSTQLSSAFRADISYIRQAEGGLQTTGYALNGTTHPHSGVTIGRGVDLGTKSAAQLSAWGVSSAGVATLTPYIGIQGTAAEQVISTRGAPIINVADATALSNGAENQIFGQAIQYFNGLNPVTKFEALPEAGQTVLLDIAYNLGSLSEAPTFASFAASGDWNDARRELQTWTGSLPDPLANRHNADAQKLVDAIVGSALPQNGCAP